MSIDEIIIRIHTFNFNFTNLHSSLRNKSTTHIDTLRNES